MKVSPFPGSQNRRNILLDWDEGCEVTFIKITGSLSNWWTSYTLKTRSWTLLPMWLEGRCCDYPPQRCIVVPYNIPAENFFMLKDTSCATKYIFSSALSSVKGVEPSSDLKVGSWSYWFWNVLFSFSKSLRVFTDFFFLLFLSSSSFLFL